MEIVIETDRLRLRPIIPTDDKDIYEYSCNDNVGRNAGWKPHESIEVTRELMKLIFLDKDGVFGIELRESGKLIGSIGLVFDPKREHNGVRMLGYAIGEQYWNKGYMTEAAKRLVKYGFDYLGLELISAYCYPSNIRSKNVLRKLGFQYEGTLSLCEKLYDGNVYDNECYALKRPLTT